MNDDIKRLVEQLREHAEWAHANEWETPITLGDDIDEAAGMIEKLARERDAALKDLWGSCSACIHYYKKKITYCRKFEECMHGAGNWDGKDHWKWRRAIKKQR